jgi:hypothetical protein
VKHSNNPNCSKWKKKKILIEIKGRKWGPLSLLLKCKMRRKRQTRNEWSHGHVKLKP